MPSWSLLINCWMSRLVDFFLFGDFLRLLRCCLGSRVSSVGGIWSRGNFTDIGSKFYWDSEGLFLRAVSSSDSPNEFISARVLSYFKLLNLVLLEIIFGLGEWAALESNDVIYDVPWSFFFIFSYPVSVFYDFFCGDLLFRTGELVDSHCDASRCLVDDPIIFSYSSLSWVGLFNAVLF